MVRALASHQCGPGSTPGPGVICGLSLLLVLVFAPRGFSPGTPVFPSPQKPTFPNSNSIRNPRVTGLSVPDCCVSPSLNKVDFNLKSFLHLFSYKLPVQKTGNRQKNHSSGDCHDRSACHVLLPDVTDVMPGSESPCPRNMRSAVVIATSSTTSCTRLHCLLSLSF